MTISEHLINGDVVGNDPADPGKGAQRREQVTREEVPDGGGTESIEEETLSAETTTVTNTSISLSMQSVKQGTGDQISGPDCVRRHKNDREEDIKLAYSWKEAEPGSGEQFRR